jgi:hypothetical protein
MGMGILARLIWRVGVIGNYRRTFWRLAWPSLKAGDIEPLIHTAIISHHLIAFTRDCLDGLGESSFYASAEVGDPERASHASPVLVTAPRSPAAPR